MLAQRLHTARVKMFRSVLNAKYNSEVRLTDEQVLRKMNAPSVHNLLRKDRLHYLARLLLHGPLALKGALQQLLQHPSSWSSLVCDDLKWAHNVSCKLSGLPPPCDDIRSWESFITSFPRQWNTIITQITSEIPFDCDQSHSEAVVPIDCFCPECDRVFHSVHALNGHRMRVHGYRVPARAYIEGSICPTCLWQFHSRPRLLYHMSHTSSKCLMQYILRGASSLDPERVKQLNFEDAAVLRHRRRSGRHKLWAELPAFRTQGPTFD